jgi:hypothetical protein
MADAPHSKIIVNHRLESRMGMLHQLALVSGVLP